MRSAELARGELAPCHYQTCNRGRNASARNRPGFQHELPRLNVDRSKPPSNPRQLNPRVQALVRPFRETEWLRLPVRQVSSRIGETGRRIGGKGRVYVWAIRPYWVDDRWCAPSGTVGVARDVVAAYPSGGSLDLRPVRVHGCWGRVGVSSRSHRALSIRTSERP